MARLVRGAEWDACPFWGNGSLNCTKQSTKPVGESRLREFCCRDFNRRINSPPNGHAIYSQHALDYIAGSAQRPRLPLPVDVELRVMHVLPPLPSADMLAGAWSMGPEVFARLPVDPSDQAQWQIEEECQGQEHLDRAVNRLRSAGWEAAGVLRRGDAATEIIDTVKATDTDLIVAGSRGFGQVKAWLMGSVSRKLVHYAPCSVLIVKSSKREDA